MEMELEEAAETVQQIVSGAMGMNDFLMPVLALVCWTIIMWFWMYVTRIPAMQKAGIDPNDARHPGTYGDRMPASVRSVADNYNHLHEQPTIFYALMFYAALTGGMTSVALYAAWAYVGLRVLHSIVQIVIGTVTLRFMVFSLASIALFVLAGTQLVRLLG